MSKEFLPYGAVRNNALKLAKHIRDDGFEPDVIYAALRGGAYMANVISEYFMLARRNARPALYAAVVARSYTDVRSHSRVIIDGWTYPPEYLRAGDRVLLVDDIFDTGDTINCLAELLMEHGIPRADLKIAVHDYKVFPGRPPLPVQPDYWCRKITVAKPEDNRWIHYMSHELVGLTPGELEANYYNEDPALRDVFGGLL